MFKPTYRAHLCKGKHRWFNVRYDHSGVHTCCRDCKSQLRVSVNDNQFPKKIIKEYFLHEFNPNQSSRFKPRNNFARASRDRTRDELMNKHNESKY